MHHPSRLILVGLLAVTACLWSRNRRPDSPATNDPPVRLHVTNHYGLPMEVSVVGGGSQHRLGLVNPGMEGTFEVLAVLVVSGQVEFEARPTTTNRSNREVARSGRLSLFPGHYVDFVIGAQLFNSAATVH